MIVSNHPAQSRFNENRLLGAEPGLVLNVSRDGDTTTCSSLTTLMVFSHSVGISCVSVSSRCLF